MADSRQSLTDRVIQRKQAIWGDTEGRHGYSNNRSIHNVIRSPNGKRPSLALLKWAANATDAELIAAAHQGGVYSFLFYH